MIIAMERGWRYVWSEDYVGRNELIESTESIDVVLSINSLPPIQSLPPTTIVVHQDFEHVWNMVYRYFLWLQVMVWKGVKVEG